MKSNVLALITAVVGGIQLIINGVLTYLKPVNYLAWINVTDAVSACIILCCSYFVIKEVKKIRRQ